MQIQKVRNIDAASRQELKVRDSDQHIKKQRRVKWKIIEKARATKGIKEWGTCTAAEHHMLMNKTT